jgi:3-oxoacyl-[acyl-carrier protein] reductase
MDSSVAGRTVAPASSLADRVALVTGSARGIGAAAARELARRGARVVVHGRDAAALERVRAELGAFAVTGDVTRAADLAAMREAIEQRLGPVDILVANAGGNPQPPMPVDVLPESVWRETIDLNLTATFLTVQCFLPAMKERRRGSIVTVSSAAARRAHPGAPIAYAAAKAAIELFTQDVAAQMGPHGIRANCVAPETILTERNQARIPEPTKQQMIAQHPLARLGTPDDVAHAVAFLASDEESWITGIVVDVAGGAVLPR